MREEIEKYIVDHYDMQQDYPWRKYPEHAVFRHKHNKKWFALIMDVPYAKLGINKAGMVNILNVKCIPEMIGSLREEVGILPAYHMNKEHWITILLDNTIPKENIRKLIDVSYELTKEKL